MFLFLFFCSCNSALDLFIFNHFFLFSLFKLKKCLPTSYYPPPPATTNKLSVFICFFLLNLRFHIQTRSHGICLSLSDLLHLSIMPWRSIYIVANGKISFSFNNISLGVHVCVHHTFIHLPINRNFFMDLHNIFFYPFIH